MDIHKPIRMTMYAICDDGDGIGLRIHQYVSGDPLPDYLLHVFVDFDQATTKLKALNGTLK